MPRASSAPLLNTALGVYVLCLKCFDSWDITDDPRDPARTSTGERNGRVCSGRASASGSTRASRRVRRIRVSPRTRWSAGEPRILMWGSWYEGATGFLYYSITGLTRERSLGTEHHVYEDRGHCARIPGNHDGTFAPAGSPANIAIDGPIPSLRLKMVRAGLGLGALRSRCTSGLA